jgi:nucleoside-diphosphate kinase
VERTLILLKPDAVSRGLIGAVISRFEQKGFKIVAMKMVKMSKNVAEGFYSPHKGKPFFAELVSFMTSGPIVAVVLEGNSAVEVVRSMIGATKSPEAVAGTIRGDYSLAITENIIHASDSAESFQREYAVISRLF